MANRIPCHHKVVVQCITRVFVVMLVETNLLSCQLWMVWYSNYIPYAVLDDDNK